MLFRSTIALIGASRGIGLALLEFYAGAGWRVHATVRDLDGPASDVKGDVQLHLLDVTDETGVDRFASELPMTDVLIHNAGVYGTGMTRDALWAVNVDAPIRMAEAVLPRLPPGGKMVLVTSQMGARRGGTGSLGAYGDSKAALNDAFRARARRWHEAGAIAIVLHPGWVKTDMGGRNASLTPQQSAEGIATVVESLAPKNHGQFLTWDGREHPW